MGRIAEALKKAEQERTEKLRLGILEPPFFPPESRIPLRPGPLIAGRMRDVHPAALLDACQPPLGSFQLGVTEKQIRHNEGVNPDAARFEGWDVHRSIVAVTQRSGLIAEQYRAIRTWLISHSSESGRFALAITSSIPREGKSVTVGNLAASFAEIAHLNVLAVDADLRQGGLCRLLGLQPSPGLADALAGRATVSDILRTTPAGNLSVVPAGSLPSSGPTDLLSSRAAHRLFAEFRERFDVVLVDTPAVQGLSDAGVIGALCAGVLMVVRMRSTPSLRLRESIQRLQDNKLRVLGCIPTACDPRVDRLCRSATN